MLHSPSGLKPDASWPRPPRLVLSLYSKVGPERRLVDLRPMPGTVLWLRSTVTTWPAAPDSFAHRAQADEDVDRIMAEIAALQNEESAEPTT